MMNRIEALTIGHYEVMLACIEGATVWDYSCAMLLREVRAADPGLITIFPLEELEAMTGETYDGGERLPYFGAILTEKGRETVNEFFRRQALCDNLSRGLTDDEF